MSQTKQTKGIPAPQTVDVDVNGVTVTVDLKVFDDWNFLDDLARIEAAGSGESTDVGDQLRVVAIVRRIFGKQYRDVLATLADDEGHIPVQGVMDALTKVLSTAAPNS